MLLPVGPEEVRAAVSRTARRPCWQSTPGPGFAADMEDAKWPQPVSSSKALVVGCRSFAVQGDSGGGITQSSTLPQMTSQ